MPRQDVPPHDGVEYSDIFWSSLYATLSGFGFAEVQLIWMRYSAFLVAHSAFIGLIGRGSFPDPSLVAILAVAGLVLTGLWMAMNSLGWMNQNFWYWHAARLKFTGLNGPLPTDSFAQEDVPKPSGDIFRIAQGVPAVFVAAYAVVMESALGRLGFGTLWATLLSLAAALVVLGIAWRVHGAFFKKIRTGNKPL